MKKESLLRILAAMPDETPVNAVFSYGRTYSIRYISAITGISIYADKDGHYTAALCISEVVEQETDEPAEKVYPGMLSKNVLANLLHIVPDGADLKGRYTYKDREYPVDCIISRLSLQLNTEGTLTASFILYECKEDTAADLDKVA